MLLLREQQGPRLWNYPLTHEFMTIDHRELLVASISSVSFCFWHGTGQMIAWVCFLLTRFPSFCQWTMQFWQFSNA